MCEHPLSLLENSDGSQLSHPHPLLLLLHHKPRTPSAPPIHSRPFAAQGSSDSGSLRCILTWSPGPPRWWWWSRTSWRGTLMRWARSRGLTGPPAPPCNQSTSKRPLQTPSETRIDDMIENHMLLYIVVANGKHEYVLCFLMPIYQIYIEGSII